MEFNGLAFDFMFVNGLLFGVVVTEEEDDDDEVIPERASFNETRSPTDRIIEGVLLDVPAMFVDDTDDGKFA